MWRNYLTVGFRTLVRDRIYAFINIFGLAIGLAACLILVVYVRYERSYDSWVPGADRVFQVQDLSDDPQTGAQFSLQMSQYLAGTTLAHDFPQIESRVAVLPTSAVVLRGSEALSVSDAVAVDGPFFDVLPLPLASGDPRSALAQPGSVVLSEAEAQRLFGAASPLGRILTLVQRGRHVDYRVTGLLRDLPRNSHLRMRMIVRMDFPAFFADQASILTSWGEISGYNYVRLRPGADIRQIVAGLPAWKRRNVPPPREGGMSAAHENWQFANIRDVHLGDVQEGGMAPGNDGRTLTTFSIVAFLVLFMAVVNFTNLATARASRRAREVALRKVLGANRKQLIVQFIGESILLAFVSMLLALAATELLLPALSNFLDADLRLDYFGSGGLALPIVGLMLAVGAVGGIYPAFYLSRFQPVSILKANKSAPDGASAGLIRNVLVVAQFAVSIALIICTAIVYAQTAYARTADPGFRREGILQISNLDRRQIAPQAEAMAREIARVPGVLSIARTAIGISTENNMSRDVFLPGRTQGVNIGNYAVDENFFHTMAIRLLAGRGFDPARLLDRLDVPSTMSAQDQAAITQRGGNVVVNALAAQRLGFRTPAEAIGRQMRVALFPFTEGAPPVPVTIVGVVNDTRFRSIRAPIQPIMYRLGSDYQAYLVVRYDTARAASVRDRIAEVWRRLAPDVPFDARFSDEIVAELYHAEQTRAETFAAFALLAVIVACLGLYGLAAFTAERRTKEIGIRKVLGARSRDIVRLLAWQFSLPVILANLIAWPVAWWVMRDWLNTFDSRIELGPAPFLAAGLLALVIAIGTIAGHALKVARANPILALRYE